MVNSITPAKIKDIEEKYKINVSKYWLNLFLESEKHQLGVVKASGKVIGDETQSGYRGLQTLVGDYHTLQIDLGLTLPLVLGGGPQYDKLPAYKDSFKVNDQIRVTSRALLEQILPAAKENLERVVVALNEGGVEAVGLPFSVFRAKPRGFEVDRRTGQSIDTGFVGDVEYVDTAPIIELAYQGKTAVMSHIGLDESGQEYNTNAIISAAAVVKWLQASKLILLADTPIYDKKKEIISEIKSEAHFHSLVQDGTITGGAVLNGQQGYDLLREMGPGRSVQFTTLANLMAELLTDGVGTILRMPFIIQTFYSPDHYSTKGKEDLKELINDSFRDRRKRLIDGYWDMLDDEGLQLRKIYADIEKTGGAIVRDLNGVAYMCKLFTHPDYRGSGLASQIIERINADYGGLIWRTEATEENESLGFYTHFVESFNKNGLQKPDRFTGFEKLENYMVFGVNLEPEKWQENKMYAARLQPTMI